MGAGEFGGAYANLRALFYVLGPLLLAKVYAMEQVGQIWRGGAFHTIATLGVLIPALMHCSWKDADLFPQQTPQEKR